MQNKFANSTFGVTLGKKSRPVAAVLGRIDKKRQNKVTVESAPDWMSERVFNHNL